MPAEPPANHSAGGFFHPRQGGRSPHQKKTHETHRRGSKDPDIATVDDMGTVIARALGTTMIAASAVYCTGEFVEPSVVTDPGTVTDLEVIAMGEEYVTLQWTEVDDGTGEPASYAIRFDSPTLSWGSAYDSEVSVDGTSIGEPTTYTLTELASDTDYQFALVSYRGTLNDGATFAETSNFVTATTGNMPEASVTVSPSSLRLEDVDQTATLTVEVRESDGSLVEDPEVTWTSQDTDIATVDETGMVTARALGTAVIVATTVCCGEGTAGVTVGENDLHPNEPAGMTVLGSADGSIAYNDDGAFGIPAFTDWYGHTGGGEENVTVVSDANNPTGSGKAVRLTWITSMGEAAISDMTFPGGPWKEIYITHRVVQPSCWTGDDSGHKWFYFLPDGESNEGQSIWTSQQRNDDWRVVDGVDNIVANGPGVLDIRNDEMLMEFLFIAESSPTAADGEVYLWLNGTLIASSTNVRASMNADYNTHWRRIHYYAHANESPPGDCYWDVREFYVSGK